MTHIPESGIRKCHISLFFKVQLSLIEDNTNPGWWEDLPIPSPKAGFEDPGQAFSAVVGGARPLASRQALSEVARGPRLRCATVPSCIKVQPLFFFLVSRGASLFSTSAARSPSLSSDKAACRCQGTSLLQYKGSYSTPESFSFHLGAKQILYNFSLSVGEGVTQQTLGKRCFIFSLYDHRQQNETTALDL